MRRVPISRSWMVPLVTAALTACIDPDVLPDLGVLDGEVDGTTDRDIDPAPDDGAVGGADDGMIDPADDGMVEPTADDGMVEGAPDDGGVDMPRCPRTDLGEAVGEPCVVGLGQCAAEGRWRCTFEGEWICDAVPGEADRERCNMLDDDCDGAVDEDATDELCNGVDDDCDGMVDEEIAPGAACVTDRPGVCAAGRERCVAAAFRCVAEVAASPEVCNGLDDDCDDATDEALPPRVIDDPDSIWAHGVCAGAVEACVEGDWLRPDPGERDGYEADEASCDDADNDCDGATDEGFAIGEPCAVGAGRCESAGVWGCDPDDVAAARCDAEPLDAAQAEVCDGIDDDCDGTTDEDVAGAGEPCETGLLGACAPGHSRCVEGRGGWQLGCVPDTLERPERCDGVDRDCDGAVDEDPEVRLCADAILPAFAHTAVGRCPAGACVTDCVGGFVDVDGDVENGCECVVAAEACDGDDDDCDGIVDEGVQNACGGCGAVPADICDGRDNDCDGGVDEGVQNACGGCGAVPAEVCDGVDNDCDGGTDEGLRNACGQCLPGPAEVCNGVDDNCNGLIDEGFNDNNGCWPRFVCSGAIEIFNGRAIGDRLAFVPNAGAGSVAVIMPLGYDPDNDQDFEYNLQVRGNEFVAYTGRGRGTSKVSAKICALTMRQLGAITTAGWQTTRARQDADPPQNRVTVPEPVFAWPRGVASQTFSQIEAYMTEGDNDFGYAVSWDGRTMTLATNAESNDNLQVLGRGHLMRYAADVLRIERCFNQSARTGDANVLGAPGLTCTIDGGGLPAGEWAPAFSEPIVSVSQHITGPDGDAAIDDLSHYAGCEARDGRRWDCSLRVWNPGNDNAADVRVYTEYFMLWRKTAN